MSTKATRRLLAVEIKGVSVRYNDHTALEDIDLEIERGRYVGIFGPNGAGKSTLVKVILGLVKPSSGRVLVFGSPPQELRGRGRIMGYLPQKPLANPNFPLTVMDVVMMGRYGMMGPLKRPGPKDIETVREQLQMVGISHLADRPIGELSGGEQQRVFIARALSVEPKLLVLDEPTVSLDACAQDELCELIVRLKEEKNLTVLMVCHDLAIMTRYVDDVICINKRLHIHQRPPIGRVDLENTFGCSVEYLFHGHVPEKVVSEK
jgi:zinc transport system ATP-binding protein